MKVVEPGHKREPIKEGDYGVVYIEKGEHRGQLGFYDDDDRRDLIIVYLSTPIATPYVVVRRSSVRRATEKEEKEWEELHTNEFTSHKNWKNYQKQVSDVCSLMSKLGCFKLPSKEKPDEDH